MAEWLAYLTLTLEVSGLNPEAGIFFFFSPHFIKSNFSCFWQVTNTIDPILKMAENKLLPQSKNKSLRMKIIMKLLKNIFPTRGFELGSPNPKSAMLTSQPRIYKKCLKKTKNCWPALLKLKFQTTFYNEL